MTQLRRTCAPGARVAIGHRGRAAEGVQEQLRREMGRRVAALTHERPADRSKRRKVLRDLQQAGAEAQPDEVVARWQSITRIDATLAGWGQKSVLAGVPLEPTTRDPLLAELAAWARERFGSLDVEHPCHEHFTLQSVRL